MFSNSLVAIVYEKPQKLLKIRVRKPPEYCDSQNYLTRNYARAMSSSLSHQHSTRQFSTWNNNKRSNHKGRLCHISFLLIRRYLYRLIRILQDTWGFFAIYCPRIGSDAFIHPEHTINAISTFGQMRCAKQLWSHSVQLPNNSTKDSTCLNRQDAVGCAHIRIRR